MTIKHRETDERAGEFTRGIGDGVPEIIKNVCLVLARRSPIVVGAHRRQ